MDGLLETILLIRVLTASINILSYDLGLTGIITEFPKSAMSVVKMLRE